MVFIPATEEDLIKSEIYSEISKKTNEDNISKYTIKCIREYEIAISKNKTKVLKKIKRKKSLEEKLFECALEHENAESDAKREIDRKALKIIRRCCKRSFMFIREYYRDYIEMKKKVFYIP